MLITCPWNFEYRINRIVLFPHVDIAEVSFVVIVAPTTCSEYISFVVTLTKWRAFVQMYGTVVVLICCSQNTIFRMYFQETLQMMFVWIINCSIGSHSCLQQNKLACHHFAHTLFHLFDSVLNSVVVLYDWAYQCGQYLQVQVLVFFACSCHHICFGNVKRDQIITTIEN